MWLASLAPPRSSPRMVRPSRSLAAVRSEREQGVPPLVGCGARVRRDAPGLDAQCPRRLAAHDHALVAARSALAGLEAEAAVDAGEALGVREPVRSPLLVGHEKERELGVV